MFGPKNPGKTFRTSPLRALIAMGSLALLTFGGALGYRIIESWDWGDSFYMVFITLSTVGFGEVHELSDAGRLWTIGLLVGGVAAAAYGAAVIIEALLEGFFIGYGRRRRMDAWINSLDKHYIICGYGRVGSRIAAALTAQGTSFLVVDLKDPGGKMEQEGIPHLIGNAEEETVLKQAGIERAQCLITAVDSDTENVFITITARVLNPSIRIIARAGSRDTERKLKLVGANRVVSPYITSGHRMARLALRPNSVEITDILLDPLQGLSVEMSELEISPGSLLDGITLRDSKLGKRTGVIVVALREGDDLTFNPSPDRILDGGDRIVLMGSREQCAKAETMASVED